MVPARNYLDFRHIDTEPYQIFLEIRHGTGEIPRLEQPLRNVVNRSGRRSRQAAERIERIKPHPVKAEQLREMVRADKARAPERPELQIIPVKTVGCRKLEATLRHPLFRNAGEHTP